MSFQEIILNSLNSLQSNDDLRGAFQHMINSGVQSTEQNGDWHPTIDIVDTTNNLYVYMELPGVTDDNICIDFYNTKLTISGTKNKKYTQSTYKHEIVYGNFNRTIILPLSVTNKANVSVTYTNGVLVLIINKQQEEQNKA